MTVSNRIRLTNFTKPRNYFYSVSTKIFAAVLALLLAGFSLDKNPDTEKIIEKMKRGIDNAYESLEKQLIADIKPEVSKAFKVESDEGTKPTPTKKRRQRYWMAISV